MPPTIGTNVLGRKVLYLPSFFTYGECASKAGETTLAEKKHQTGSRPCWPWGTLGSMAPRVRAGMEEGIEECGQRQQVSGWEQVNDTAVVQLLFPQPLPSAQAAGGADRCAREGPVQDTGPCHPCCSRFVWNGVGIRAFCLPSSLALLLSFSLSVFSSSFPSFFVLFPLCSSAWC